MRLSRSAFLLTALLAAFAVPAHAEDDVPPPKPLVEQRGMTMSAQDAMTRITFRPFVPSRSYSEVALLPPFSGDDKDHPENRGIAYEYTSGGHTYLLREWPLGKGSINQYPEMKPVGSCKTGHSMLGPAGNSRGQAWTTQSLVFALQPDTFGGTADVRALANEWARLIKRGACR